MSIERLINKTGGDMKYTNLTVDPSDLTTSDWKSPNLALEDIEESRAVIEYISNEQMQIQAEKVGMTVKSKQIQVLQYLGKHCYRVVGVLKGNVPGQKGDTFTISFIMKRTGGIDG